MFGEVLFAEPNSGDFFLADRKSFLLRVDPALLNEVQRWADEDLRSLNGQIEFLLRKSLRDAGRKVPPAKESSRERVEGPDKK